MVTNIKRYNLPKCAVCTTDLRDKRSFWCKKHVPKDYCTGKPGPMMGKRWKLDMTPERRERWIKASSARKHSESTKAKIRKWHIENPNRVYSDTSIEKVIESALKAKGIKFEKQARIAGISRVDFYIPDQKTIIQCDGCYWHNCPQHYPTHHTEQRIKDEKKDKMLNDLGFKVIRLWEHDIKKIGVPIVNNIVS